MSTSYTCTLVGKTTTIFYSFVGFS